MEYFDVRKEPSHLSHLHPRNNEGGRLSTLNLNHFSSPPRRSVKTWHSSINQSWGGGHFPPPPSWVLLAGIIMKSTQNQFTGEKKNNSWARRSHERGPNKWSKEAAFVLFRQRCSKWVRHWQDRESGLGAAFAKEWHALFIGTLQPRATPLCSFCLPDAERALFTRVIHILSSGGQKRVWVPFLSWLLPKWLQFNIITRMPLGHLWGEPALNANSNFFIIFITKAENSDQLTRPVSVSYGCCNTLLKTLWLEKKKSVIILESGEVNPEFYFPICCFLCFLHNKQVFLWSCGQQEISKVKGHGKICLNKSSLNVHGSHGPSNEIHLQAEQHYRHRFEVVCGGQQNLPSQNVV